MKLFTTAVLGAVMLAVASAQFSDAPAAPPPAGPPPAGPPPAGPPPAEPAPQTCVPPPPASACACANAQPITIQLSCSGGGNRRPSGSRPPPPPPPQYSQPPMYETTAVPWHGWETTAVPSVFDGYDMNNFCKFDDEGYPDPALSPPGGFPPGFRAHIDASNNPIIETAPGVPRPPPNWDGSAATLGFPMPPMGTPEGNMLLCWPIPVVSG